jgi:NAD(P)-dependent dehydrogenase (short-subunit alcohol dehydrogenase family)
VDELGGLSSSYGIADRRLLLALTQMRPCESLTPVRDLAGKVIVVAGGAGGIGTATCQRLAAEGGRIVAGDLNADEAGEVAERITSNGGTAIGVHVDIADEASVQALIATAVSHFGGIDGMHVNAADLSATTLAGDSDVVSMKMETFDHVISVNLRGHFLCTRYVLPALLDRGGGALVYTTSDAAFVGEPERPAYAIAKAGICALVRHVASKWGKDRIRANAVSPGVVVTPTVAGASAEQGLGRLLARTRSWRLGEPSDVAATVAHLLSDDGEWINGQVISVNGGMILR